MPHIILAKVKALRAAIDRATDAAIAGDQIVHHQLTGYTAVETEMNTLSDALDTGNAGDIETAADTLESML